MAYKILWSEKAVEDLEEILEYLQKEWGVSTEDQFKESLSKRLHLLSEFPKLHKVSDTNPIYRQSVLNKHISIIYSLEKESIFIVRLFNNKSNPEKPK